MIMAKFPCARPAKGQAKADHAVIFLARYSPELDSKLMLHMLAAKPSHDPRGGTSK